MDQILYTLKVLFVFASGVCAVLAFGLNLVFWLKLNPLLDPAYNDPKSGGVNNFPFAAYLRAGTYAIGIAKPTYGKKIFRGETPEVPRYLFILCKAFNHLVLIAMVVVVVAFILIKLNPESSSIESF